MRVAGRRRHRWLRRLVATIVVLVVVVGLAVGALLVLTPPVGDAEARVAAAAASHHVPDPLGPPPVRVAAALVAVEDSRFYSEPGVDPLAAGKLLLVPVLGPGEAPGATLDQQLAKNLYTHGRSTARDQAEQFGLALKLDAAYSKPELLRMYLNTVYFGHTFYGVTAASEGYFGVTPDRLSWPQAAMLAGLMQAPTAYDPYAHPQLALSRRAHVLDRLAATGTLTAAQAAAYAATPLSLAT